MKNHMRQYWVNHSVVACILVVSIVGLSTTPSFAEGMMAGVAKVDITDYDSGPANDPLHVKALVLKTDDTMLTIITVDVVAIGEYGRVGNEYLPAVRARLQAEYGIDPNSLFINASHCHGTPRADVADLTVQAVAAALQKLVPVHVGAGSGHEDRISENRRFTLKNGDQVDSRRAYSLPPDEDFAAVGPIDPEIGVLRLDRENGDTLAVLYNFAVHPIQGVPNGGNTADLVGYASKVIEESLGNDAMAFFVQGCAGDINPAMYKDVTHPPDAEPLGNLLGLSTLRAVNQIVPVEDNRLTVIHETLDLPLADFTERIAALEAQRDTLLDQLQGTPINLKTYVPLLIQYNLSESFPSHYAHRYLHEEMQERKHLDALDAQNRDSIKRYTENIHVMERLTRVQANLKLLEKHQAANSIVFDAIVKVEVLGIRIGEAVFITFPGELTVQIGLNIKSTSPYEHTFVAGYTNGYIFYAPTAEQLRNTGSAQEDCDTILAPEWQSIFEQRAGEIVSRF